MATGKTIRKIQLKRRQVIVTNLNFQPEKAGPDQLVERVDLSLTFVVKDMEVDEFVSAKGNPLKLLWHSDGTVMFRDLQPIGFDFKAEGTLEIGVSDEHLLKFKGATLKKVTVMPYIERQAEVKCQVRIDPTGNMEELGQIRIHEKCIFSFEGLHVEKGKNKDQTELEV